MASEMADMCTMGGSDLSGGIPMGSVEDVAVHKDDKLPMPKQPAMVHGTGMAGHEIGAPASWPMSQMR